MLTVCKMDYNKLETRSVIKILSKGQTKKVSESKINKELKWCHNNYCFSTYSYCKNKKTGKRLSSKEIVKKTHTGNCIGMSYGLKEILKKKYGIQSFLVPATVPESFQREGYLEISHVALMIPGNKPWEFFLADPAFYFLKPLAMKPSEVMGESYSTTGKMSNIYNKSEVNVENFEARTKVLKTDLTLNTYQKIEKLTPIVECVQINTGNLYGGIQSSCLEWSYFITEIKNPDEAITSFFQEIWKRTPFITRTQTQKGQVVCRASIHQKEDNRVVIKKYNIPYYDGLVRDLTLKEMKYWKKIFNLKMFKQMGKWRDYLIRGEKCYF